MQEAQQDFETKQMTLFAKGNRKRACWEALQRMTQPRDARTLAGILDAPESAVAASLGDLYLSFYTQGNIKREKGKDKRMNYWLEDKTQAYPGLIHARRGEVEEKVIRWLADRAREDVQIGARRWWGMWQIQEAINNKNHFSGTQIKKWLACKYLVRREDKLAFGRKGQTIWVYRWGRRRDDAGLPESTTMAQHGFEKAIAAVKPTEEQKVVPLVQPDKREVASRLLENKLQNTEAQAAEKGKAINTLQDQLATKRMENLALGEDVDRLEKLAEAQDAVDQQQEQILQLTEANQDEERRKAALLQKQKELKEKLGLL